MNTQQQMIIEISHRSLAMTGEAHADRVRDPSCVMAPLWVVAREGNGHARSEFISRLQSMASRRWGVDESGTGQFLNDAFAMRSMVECIDDALVQGVLSGADDAGMFQWLYDFAAMRVDGSMARHPKFMPWHLRNQNVPATTVYSIADLLDRHCPDRFETGALWDWADDQLVGWDLTWRSPDDAWLYLFIWAWSAYIHARLRRPDLLSSENARRSTSFYRDLAPPGGVELIFGDTKPGDLLGPAVALMLGARLFEDGELLWNASQLIERTLHRGKVQNIIDRGPELFRLYQLCPADLQPIAPVHRRSIYVTSPLADRGWAIGGAPYNERIKATHDAFPERGRSRQNYDAVYQMRQPERYRAQKPDKVVFAREPGANAMFAALDLRCHGLHDHADAAGIITLIDRGVPWLIESTYQPKEHSFMRWCHNVPLVLVGAHGPERLQSIASDTWPDIDSEDVCFSDDGDLVRLDVTIRHDAFDYVDFRQQVIDVTRTVLFLPEQCMAVIDQFSATCATTATLAQIWHTTATPSSTSVGLTLTRDDKQLAMATFATEDVTLHRTQRTPTQHDPFYFPEDAAIHDLMWWQTSDMAQGDVQVMGACFSRTPITFKLVQRDQQWFVRVAGHEVAIDCPLVPSQAGVNAS